MPLDKDWGYSAISLRIGIMRLILAALALLCTPVLAAAAQPKCTPGDLASLVGRAGAIDGDTLALIVDGRRTPNIRLWGVDAPELRDAAKLESPAGMQARVAISDLVHGRPVTVQPIECDNYGRIVATVEVGGVDVLLAMARAR
ncbi:MAG: thermonuclease family protein [Alphaproteobacteria bacterium]|nr:thermonuclease family protein [Alphaproteobacteria bacterium]